MSLENNFGGLRSRLASSRRPAGRLSRRSTQLRRRGAGLAATYLRGQALEDRRVMAINVAVVGEIFSGDQAGFIATRDQLNNDTYFDFNAVLVTSSQVDTLAELSAYDVVLIGSNGTSSGDPFNNLTFTAALRNWVETQGGGVVMTGWGVYGAGIVTGTPNADIDAIIPVNTSGSYNWFTGATLSVINGAHPVTQGVSSFAVGGYTEYPTSGIDGGATVLATTNGQPTVVVGSIASGRGVYLGPTYVAYSGHFTGDLRSGMADRLLEQAVAWAAGDANLTTDIAVSGNNLVITDIDGGNTNDTLTITLDGANVRVSDPNNLLNAGSGTTQDGPNAVLIPFASISTGSIQVNTLGGDDTLTLNFSAGNFLPAGGLLYDGGAQTTGDSLVLSGGTTTSSTHTFTSATSGSITLAGALAGTISYSGLEPVLDTMTIADRVFTFAGGAESVTLADNGIANDTLSVIDSTLGEITTFANATNSLTINLTNGSDTLTISGLDGREPVATPYSANLIINGDGGDTVTFTTAAINVGAGNVEIGTTGGQPIQSIHFNGGALQTTGTVSLQAAGAVATNGAATDVFATNLVAVAGAGVALDTAVTNLEADGGSGGVDIEDVDALTIGGIGSTVGISAIGGDIVVVARGTLTANESVSNSGGGGVTLTTIGGGTTIVGGSTLLSPTDAAQLATWLGEGSLTLTKIFTKTVGGGQNSSQFHAAVDGQGRTFSIIEVLPTFGNPHHVIGGYNPQSWNGALFNYNYTPSDAQRTGFIFNLDTLDLRLQKLSSSPDSGGLGQYQTYNHFSYGPTFGGGHDIFVNSSLSSGYSYKYSYGTPGTGSPSIVGGSGSNTLEYGTIEIFTIAPAAGVASDLVLNASVTASGGNGNINLSASADILHNSGTVSAANSGNVTYTAGTVTTDGEIAMAAGTQATSNTGNIALTADANITLGQLATAGNVTVSTAGAGAILSGAAATDIVGNNVSLVAGSGGIGASGNPVAMDANALNTSTSGNANQFLRELNTATIDATGLAAGAGRIELTGGTLVLGGANRIANATDVTVSGGASLDIGGFTETIDQLTLVDGQVTGSGGTLTGASTYDLRQGSISANLAGSVGLTKSTSALVTLSGVNSYTGATTIVGGVLSVSSLANGGANSGLGASSSAAANLVLNGGTLRYTGPSTSTNRLFTLGANGGTIDVSGTGPVNFTNTGAIVAASGGARTLTLTGTQTASSTLAAVLGDSPGFSLDGTVGLNSALSAAFNNFHPQGLGYDPFANELLFLQQGSSTIYRTDLNGTILGTRTISPFYNHTVSIAADATNYYFSDYSGNTSGLDLFAIGKASGSATPISSETAAFGGYPIDVRNGLIYRTQPSTSYNFGNLTQIRVASIAAPDTILNTLNLTAPAGIADFSVDPVGGHIWVLDYSASAAIRQYDLATGNLLNVYSLGLDGLDAGLTYANGKLYYYNWNSGGGSTLSTYTVGSAGVTSVVKSDSGAWTLANANTYTGATTVDSGRLLASHANALGAASGNTLVNAGGTLELASSATFAEPIALNGGTLATTDATFPTLTGGINLLADSAIDIGMGSQASVNSPIVGASGFTLSGNSGGSTLRVQQANSFNGNVVVNSGVTLLLENSGTLGSAVGNTQVNAGGFLWLNNLTIASESLDLVGSSLVSSGTAAWNGPVALTGSNNVSPQGGTLSVGGAISGAGSLSVSGSGLTILSGNNSYAGATTISGGAVRMGHNNALGTTAGNTTVQSGGTLDLFGFATSEPLVISGTGSAGMGGALVNNTGIAATASGSILLAGNTTLAGAGNFTVAGVIDDGASSFALTKEGNGVISLNGANTYNGPTVINSGALYVNGSLAATSAVTVQGGTLGGTGTINNLVSANSGGSISPGTGVAGTLTINNSSGTGLSMVGGSGLLIQITGAAVYDRLDVAGAVSLGSGASRGTLNLITPGYTPAAGDQYVFLLNDGSDPIANTFVSGFGSTLPSGTNLPEGTVVSTNFLGSGLPAVITYQGGDGNDAAILVGNTTITLSGGNLTIVDAIPAGKDDDLRLKLVNVAGTDYLEIHDPTNYPAATGISGAIQVDANTVRVPWLSITGSITVDTLAGNDKLTVNYVGGDLLPAGGLFYLGGADADELTILGGNQGNVTYNYTSATDGNIVSTAYGTITYTGLEPITNTGTAADVIFNLPAGGNTVFLEDDGTSGNGLTRLRSNPATFEQTDFANPTGSVTINGGSGAEIITIDALPDFNASLAIDGQGGSDNITVAGALALGSATSNGNLSLAAESLVLQASISTDASTTGTHGNVNLAAGSSLTLAANVLLDTDGAGVDGSITITGPLNADAASNNRTLTLAAGSGTINATANMGATNNLGAYTITSAGTANIGRVDTRSGGISVTATSISLGGNLSTDGLTNSGPVSLTGAVALAAPVTIDTDNSGSDGAVSFSSTINLNAHTLTLNAGSTNYTIAGVISGSGGLTKQGTGTLTLSGANNYSGGTNVNANSGTVIAAINTTQNSLGTGAVSIGTGSTVWLNNANTSGTAVNINNAFSGPGTLRLDFAAGTTPRNTNMPNVTAFGGLIWLSNSGATGDKWNANGINASAAALQIDSGSQLFVSGGTTTFANTVVAGAGNNENRGAIRLIGTLGGPISLVGNTTIGTEGGTIAGAISATTPVTLTFGTTNSTGNATISGGINNGSGSIAVRKTAAGTVALNGGGNYSGGTTISQGTITIGNSTALGTGTVTLNDASTGANNTALLAAVQGITIANAMSVSNNGTGIATIGSTDVSGGANIQFNGVLTLAKAVTLQAGSTDRTTFGNQITGTGDVTISSPFANNRRIVFDRPSGTANNFAGRLLIGTNADLQIGVGNSIGNRTIPDSAEVRLAAGARLRAAPSGADGETFGALISDAAGAGTLDRFTGTGTFTFTIGSGNGSGAYSGVIQNTAGAVAVTKTGSGTQTLTGLSSYTGATTVSGGVLSINSLANGGVNSSIGAATAASSNLALNGGNLRYTGGNASTDRGMTLTGANTFDIVAANTTVTVSGAMTGSGSLTKSTGTTAGTFSSNTSNLTLTGNNSGWTGNFTVHGGAVTITNSNALGTGPKTVTLNNNTTGNGNLRLDGSGGNITLAANLSFSTSAASGTIFNDAGDNVINGNFTMTSGGGNTVLTSNAGSLTINGNLAPNTTGRTLVLAGAGTGAINGNINDDATNTLIVTKQNTGSWTLAGNNIYRNATNVNGGTLIVTSATGLGASSAGTVVADGATLDVRANVAAEPITSLTGNGFGGLGALIAGAGAGTVGGPVTLTGDVTLGGAGTLTISGILGETGGPRSVTKAGGGTTNLNAANAYTGATTVNAGTLNVNGSITSNVTVNAAGTLGGTGTITGNVTGTGTFGPGLSPGTQTIVGSFAPSGTLIFEVNSPWATPGVDFDRYNVTGAVNLTGSSVTFANTVDSTAPAPLALLTLIDNDGTGDLTTAASSPADGATITIGSRSFRLFYNGGDGNNVILVDASTPTVVYVEDDDWDLLTPGTIIADADFGTDGAQPAIYGVNAFNTVAAAIAAAASNGVIIVNGGTYAEAVVLSGTQSLEITGPDASDLITFNSLATAAGQTVTVEGGSTLIVGDGTSTLVAGNLNGSGKLTKQGSGTLTLAGTGITLKGDVTVNGGRLVLQDTTSFGNGATTALQMLTTASSGVLEFNVTAGTHAIGATAGLTIAGNGIVRKTGSGRLAFNEQGNSSFVVTIAMTGGLIDIQGGQIRNGGWQGQNWASNKAAMNIAAGASFDVWDGNEAYVDALTGAGSVVKGIGGARTFYIGVNGGTGDFAGTINASNPFTLRKEGLGTQTLSGTTDNNSAVAVVNAGTLVLAKTSTASVHALGGGGTVLTINNGATARLGGTGGDQIYFQGDVVVNAGGIFDLNGRSEGFDALNGGGNIRNTGAAATLTVGQNNSGGTFSGLIGAAAANGLALTKTGTGTLVLANAGSTFVGDLTVDQGIVRATAGHNDTNATSAFGNPLVARNITVASGTQLQFAANDVFGNAAASPVTTIVVNGGTVTNTGSFFNTLGPINLNAGTLSAVGGATGAYQAYRLFGTVTVSGAAPSTISASGSNAGIHLHSSTTFNIADVTSSAATDLTISATLIDRAGGAGAGSLIKTGLGRLDLTGANTYTGTTSVNAGELRVDGSLATVGTPAGTVSIASGATLSGGGDIHADVSGAAGSSITATGNLSLGRAASAAGVATSGALTVGAHSVTLRDADAATLNGVTSLNGGALSAANGLSIGGTLTGNGAIVGNVATVSGANVTPNGPGSVGTFNVNGNLTFVAGSTLTMDLNGAVAGVSYDQINVVGSIALGGASLNLLGGFAAAPGTQISLLTNDGVEPVSGQFAGFNEGQTVTVGAFTGVITYAGGFGANDVTLNTTGPATTSGTAGDDNIIIRRATGAGIDNIQVLVNGTIVDARPYSTVTTWTIDGLDGNDTLTVDYTHTGGQFETNVVFNGGNQFDTLNVTGGSWGRITYNYTNATDGNIQNFADAAGATLLSTISYTGLAPIVNTGTATNMVFNLPGTNDEAVLEDLGGGMTRLRSFGTPVTFEQTDFVNPAAGGSVTVNAGGGNDTLVVASLQSPTFAPSLILNGDAGADIVAFNRSLNVAGSVAATAESIQLNKANLAAAGAISLTGDVQLGGYAEQVALANAVAWWRLGETTTAAPALNSATGASSAGAAANGAYTAGAGVNATGLIAGDPNTALALANASADRMSTAGFEKFAGGTGFTVESWVNLAALPSGFTAILGDREAGGLDFNLMVYISNTGRVRAHVQTNTGFSSIDTVASITTGVPHHIASTWDALTGQLSIYVDGVLQPVTVSAGVNPRTGALANSNNAAIVGRDAVEAVNRANLTIDEPALYRRPMSGAEIAAHFAAGSTASNVLQVTSSSGSVSLSGTVTSAVAGLYGLNVAHAAGGSFGGQVGTAANPLASLTITSAAATQLAANVHTDSAFGSGNVTFAGGGNIVLANSLTIDTEQGDNGAGGAVAFGTSSVSGTAAGRNLVIDARPVGFTAGDVTNLAANAAGGAALNSLTVLAGNITTNAVTTVGAISLSAQDALTLNGAMNAGASTIQLSANQDGVGGQGFTQNAGGDVTTTNNTASAIGISVLGSGSAALRGLTAGTAGGAVTIGVAGGAITDGNGGALNIQADEAQLTAATGIGSADALETAVNTVAAANSGSGNVLLANTTGSLLTIGTVLTSGITSPAHVIVTHDAALTIADAVTSTGGNVSLAATGAVNVLADVTAPAGTATISSFGALNVQATVSANGLVTLDAGDTAATTDDLTLGAAAIVTSTSGSVLINVGDDFLAQAGSQVSVTGTTNTIAIHLDVADADAGSPSTLTMQPGAVFTANTNPAFAGGTALHGGNDVTGGGVGDLFQVVPLTTTRFLIDGNNPTSAVGDELEIDLTGIPTPTLTVGGIGAGQWTFGGGFGQVNYQEIETVDAIGAPYHLVVDANFPGNFGNTGVADNVTIRRDASGTELVVERTGLLNLPNDPVGVLFQGDIADILSLTYLGSSDDDAVTVSDQFGLPTFIGTLPGGQDNPDVGPLPSLLVSGGGGTDALHFLLANAAGYEQTYGLGNGYSTAGFATNEGEVYTDGAADLSTYLLDIDLVRTQVTNSGAGQKLTIVGDEANNAISVVDHVDAGYTRINAVNLNTVASYASFDWNAGSFSGGLEVQGQTGDDTLDLVSLDPAQTNFPVAFHGQDGSDDLRVRSTTSGSHVTLWGGSGNDEFQLYDALNRVTSIVSSITIDGGADTDSLTVVNTGAASPNNVVGRASTLDGMTGFGGTDVAFSAVETLDVTATNLDDTFDLSFVGGDVTAATFRGADGADRFGAGANPDVKPSLTTALTLVGGNHPGGALPPSGNPSPQNLYDQLYLDMSDTLASATMPVIVDTAGGTARSASHQTVSFNTIEWFQVKDNIDGVPGTIVPNLERGDLYLRGTALADRIIFSRGSLINAFDPTEVKIQYNNVYVQPFYPTRRIIAYGREGDDYITVSTNINPALEGVDFYGEIGNDFLAGANGIDSIWGGDGNDRIQLQQGARNYAEGGAGADSISGGAGMDTIFGQDGNDSLYGLAGNDYIDGGNDNDTIQGADGDDLLRGGSGIDRIYGGYGNDIILGGAGNDTLQGDYGRDLVLGGANNDYLRGNNDDDLVIAGTTSYDADGNAANDAALWAILSEWTSNNSFAIRRTNITNGTGLTLGNQFKANVTVFDDAARDTIYGDTGVDWIFGRQSGTNADYIPQAAGDTIDPI